MGLDANLFKVYPDEKDKLKDVESFTMVKLSDDSDLEDLIYWRKVSCLQGFIESVVEDDINCEHVLLRKGDLKNIVEIAKNELSYLEAMDQTKEPFVDTTKSEEFAKEHDGELFPPQGGFFYGPDERNEWHLSNVTEVIKSMTEVIEKAKDDDMFVYYCWY